MRWWLRQAAEGSLGPGRTLEDRASVLEEGQVAGAAYFLSEGNAEIFHISQEGFSVVVKLVTAPTILASPEVLVAEPAYRASIRALGPAIVHPIARPRFMELVRTSAANMEAVIDIALAFTGAARMESSRLFATEAVLATLLLAYADIFGTVSGGDVAIGLRRSQSDLAESVGAAERSVNRIITQWKQQGLVSKRRGLYVIHRRDRLAELAGELAGCLVHRWRDVGTEAL